MKSFIKLNTACALDLKAFPVCTVHVTFIQSMILIRSSFLRIFSSITPATVQLLLRFFCGVSFYLQIMVYNLQSRLAHIKVVEGLKKAKKISTSIHKIDRDLIELGTILFHSIRPLWCHSCYIVVFNVFLWIQITQIECEKNRLSFVQFNSILHKFHLKWMPPSEFLD